jgi:hypothetical protein
MKRVADVSSLAHTQNNKKGSGSAIPLPNLSKSIERRRKSKDKSKLRGFRGDCQGQLTVLTGDVHVLKYQRR